MIITLTNPNTGRRWKIKPYSNGLCYEVHRETKGEIGKNGKPIKSEFTFTGKYPNTLEDAIRTTINMMLTDPDDKTKIDLSASSSRTMSRHFNEAIDKFIEGITVKIRK